MELNEEHDLEKTESPGNTEIVKLKNNIRRLFLSATGLLVLVGVSAIAITAAIHSETKKIINEIDPEKLVKDLEQVNTKLQKANDTLGGINENLQELEGLPEKVDEMKKSSENLNKVLDKITKDINY